jgi:hypothetical protein
LVFGKHSEKNRKEQSEEFPEVAFPFIPLMDVRVMVNFHNAGLQRQSKPGAS